MSRVCWTRYRTLCDMLSAFLEVWKMIIHFLSAVLLSPLAKLQLVLSTVNRPPSLTHHALIEGLL